MTVIRQSNLSRAFEQSESPIVLSHSAFTGLGILLSDGDAVVTIEADLDKEGDFDVEVPFEEALEESSGVGGKFRYPTVAASNILYNCAFIRVTWDTGTVKVFQKG